MHWTILIITLNIGTIEFPVPSQEQCGMLIPVMYETYKVIDENVVVQCQPTSILAISIRPKARK